MFQDALFVYCSSGQKPFPCPKCDALFSTKSNCERHLLRKHGVTQRTLRRNGAITKKDADDGSHESAGQCTQKHTDTCVHTCNLPFRPTPFPVVHVSLYANVALSFLVVMETNG